MREHKAEEYITGAIIGLLLGVLFFHKLIFGAELSQEDKELLVKTVHAEAGNQDIEGRRLVCAVILNRVESDVFPNTVEGVLSQERQFSTYKILGKTEPDIYDAMAVQMELNERSNSEVMYFRTSRYGTGEPLFKHGDHYFSGQK